MVFLKVIPHDSDSYIGEINMVPFGKVKYGLMKEKNLNELVGSYVVVANGIYYAIKHFAIFLDCCPDGETFNAHLVWPGDRLKQKEKGT